MKKFLIIAGVAVIGGILGLGISYLVSQESPAENAKEGVSTSANVTPGAGDEALTGKFSAQKPVVSEVKDFKDWRMQCIKVSDRESCELYQHRAVKTEKQGNITVLVGKLYLQKKDDKLVPHLRIITPVGVWLPAGIAIQFDDGKQMDLPYLLCGGVGCMTDFGIADDFLPKAKKAEKLFVAYKFANQQQGNFELSMLGFTAGLDALEERNKGG